ncbi:hypothetical protein [Actinotalea fermentans]|uniref:Lipoprotein n=1 Tax=Actinotalea fermentans TaxID=43671 RepID=A0A511Z234_9CELL|nr:hypothetical protein [Actinotalea fermentans]GEN81512.1 hypothetical protein AFE02nite_32460 [Actinotalea fermentans]
MRSTPAVRRRGAWVAVVVVGLALGGCATGTAGSGPGAGDPDGPCAGGAPVRNELDGPETVTETPELIAAQDELMDLLPRAEGLAGNRLGGLWMSWTPELHLVVEVTEGPVIPDLDALAEEEGLVEVRYTATITRAELMAGVDEANAIVAASDLPWTGSSGDELNGRWVLSVPAGDDGGAATCTAFRELLADVDIPWAFEVVDAPEESTVRGPVAIGEAFVSDGPGLQLTVGSCNGDPEVTVLEQTDTEVRIEVTSTTPAPGWPGADCLDGLELTLDAPLGSRTLIDVTTGDVVGVRHT